MGNPTTPAECYADTYSAHIANGSSEVEARQWGRVAAVFAGLSKATDIDMAALPHYGVRAVGVPQQHLDVYGHSPDIASLIDPIVEQGQTLVEERVHG